MWEGLSSSPSRILVYSLIIGSEVVKNGLRILANLVGIS